MTKLKLEMLDGQTSFRPGEEAAGIAGWECETPPERVEVRLFWHTTGKGDDDAGLVDTVRFDNPSPVDAQIFRFTLPEGPYSFSGRLISLIWSIELVVEPGDHVERVDLTVSPSGEEVKLGTVDEEESLVRGDLAFGWQPR